MICSHCVQIVFYFISKEKNFVAKFHLSHPLRWISTYRKFSADRKGTEQKSSRITGTGKFSVPCCFEESWIKFNFFCPFLSEKTSHDLSSQSKSSTVWRVHVSNTAWLLSDDGQCKYVSTKDSTITFEVSGIIHEGLIQNLTAIVVWTSSVKGIIS